MPTAINAMFAIQGPEGLTFGYVYNISLEQVIFEIDSRLGIGDEIEWRMELKGYAETAMGRLIVTGFRASDIKGIHVFTGRITFLPPYDRELLTGWIKDIEEGGTSRRVERNPELHIQGILVEKHSDVAPEERKAAVDRIDARRNWAKQFQKKKKSFFDEEDAADPLGLRREASDPEEGRDEGADILEELSRALAETGESLAEPEPGAMAEALSDGLSSHAWAVPEGVDLELAAALSEALGGGAPELAPAAAPVPPLAPEVAEPLAPAPPSGPEKTLDRSARPLHLRIEYPELGGYIEDYTTSLKNRGCSLDAPDLPLWTPLRVTIRLPSGIHVEARGEIVGTDGRLAFVSLTLDPAARRSLAREAEGG